MNKEIWKDIKNYEGLYQVSNLGRVKSVERTAKHSSGNGTKTVSERIRKGTLDGCGYLTVSLNKEGIKKTHKIHRLVIEMFLDKPDNVNDWHCDHINNVKTDNRLNNLQWLTLAQNIQKGNNKETFIYDLKTKTLTSYDSMTIASEELGYPQLNQVSRSGIQDSSLMRKRYVAGYDTEQLWDNILRHSHKFNLSEKDLNKIKLQLE